MKEQDHIRSALQAEYEAETEGSFTLKHREANRQEQVVSQQGKSSSRKKEFGINTGHDDDDGDGQPLAARDGFRYDYDDNSDR